MRVPVSFRKDRRLEFLLQIPAGGRGGTFTEMCSPNFIVQCLRTFQIWNL